MKRVLLPVSMLALLLNGAIFGFFYAWICSTVWGLDQLDPNAAIQAMNAMNASVRNPVFFVGFFLTPVALGLAGLVTWRVKYRDVAAMFFAAAIIYLMGALAPTAQINVPLNNALALIDEPLALADAQQAWSAYLARWQQWNIFRTLASGAALICSGLALYRLGRRQATTPVQ